jgi:hypothetical protein
MSHKMRHVGPPTPSISWRTLVASSEDPIKFAAELQGALQELTDNGYNIVSQLQRAGSIIVTGQKVTMPVNPFYTEPQPPGPAPAPQRARMVQPAPQPQKVLQGSTSNEVLYHYIEHGKDKQQAFPSMVEALRLVKEHLGYSSLNGDTPVCPVRLVAVAMTQYDLTAIPALLKMYAAELGPAATKPLG